MSSQRPLASRLPVPSALLVVPPFLKRGSGPLLGPAMLLGAAHRAGFPMGVLDLNEAWIEDTAPPSVVRERGPFVGDHDRPSALLRAVQQAWSQLCAAYLPSSHESPLHENPHLTLMFDHDAIDTAAVRLAGGPLGAWIRHRFSESGAAPAVVGVCVMYSGQVLGALAISIVARQLWPRALVVWGGAHVTALREQIAGDAAYGRRVDRFVFGYAERTWIDLLDAVIRGAPIPTSAVPAGCGTAPMADDDAAVVPAFDARALGSAERITLPIQASRGCAYGRCTFCTYPAVEGRYREIDAAPVLDVVALAQRHSAAVSFKDSLVVPGRLALLAEMIGGRVRWSACTKLHPRLDGPFLARLAASGCATLEVGLETLTPSGQLVIDKRQNLPLFLNFLDGAEAAGIAVVVNYITGFPGVDPVEEAEWLGRVTNEVERRRPRLVAKVEHNVFQLERASPMGRAPAAFGLSVVESWPWATVMAWRPTVAVGLRAG